MLKLVFTFLLATQFLQTSSHSIFVSPSRKTCSCICTPTLLRVDIHQQCLARGYHSCTFERCKLNTEAFACCDNNTVPAAETPTPVSVVKQDVDRIDRFARLAVRTEPVLSRRLVSILETAIEQVDQLLKPMPDHHYTRASVRQGTSERNVFRAFARGTKNKLQFVKTSLTKHIRWMYSRGAALTPWYLNPIVRRNTRHDSKDSMKHLLNDLHHITSSKVRDIERPVQLRYDFFNS